MSETTSEASIWWERSSKSSRSLSNRARIGDTATHGSPALHNDWSRSNHGRSLPYGQCNGSTSMNAWLTGVLAGVMLVAMASPLMAEEVVVLSGAELTGPGRWLEEVLRTRPGLRRYIERHHSQKQSPDRR
ncbi:hypothetical protein DESC_610027 [Desulfosarcina cetonica]|nr:hypothetical protein DESC_610027 [Desulfosarcina cetonica]